jgi:hypothetical protein
LFSAGYESGDSACPVARFRRRDGIYREGRHHPIRQEQAMPRKPNYNFEKRQREIQKKEKKAAKAEAKRQQAESRKEVPKPDSPVPDTSTTG